MKRAALLFGLLVALSASSAAWAGGSKAPTANASRVQQVACAIGFRSLCPSNETTTNPAIINR